MSPETRQNDRVRGVNYVRIERTLLINTVFATWGKLYYRSAWTEAADALR
jgi:hypothetical protein